MFGDSNRPITMADLAELKYLECCIKESLRLYPSVPLIGRQTIEDTIISNSDLRSILTIPYKWFPSFNKDKHEIPAGSTVIVLNYFIHRDPKHFPDPDNFQPERFFPENSRGRHPYAYIPFSAGPRNCIGNETFDESLR